MTPILSALPPNPRILVVTLRRIGDVLLTTPLIRSLKRGIPGCRVDALVFEGTQGVLGGNPDLDNVVVMPRRSGAGDTLRLLGRLWRQYDLAASTQTGDRPMLFAFAAARRRVGFVSEVVPGRRWKQALLDAAVPVADDNHRVVELLRLAQALGLPLQPDIVCPTGDAARADIPSRPYAVLHANPMFRIRQWTDAGWRDLARALDARGLALIATGGPDPAERAYLDRIWAEAGVPILRLDGKLDWPSLAALLRDAAVYVGPDTSMSHLAAASGAPTVAIYGPESPSGIGPWPVGGLDRPWARAGTIQHRGNVWVVQNLLPCMPCNKLGCEGHLNSYSRCLDELPVQQVLTAVDQALAYEGTPAVHAAVAQVVKDIY